MHHLKSCQGGCRRARFCTLLLVEAKEVRPTMNDQIHHTRNCTAVVLLLDNTLARHSSAHMRMDLSNQRCLILSLTARDTSFCTYVLLLRAHHLTSVSVCRSSPDTVRYLYQPKRTPAGDEDWGGDSIYSVTRCMFVPQMVVAERPSH